MGQFCQGSSLFAPLLPPFSVIQTTRSLLKNSVPQFTLSATVRCTELVQLSALSPSILHTSIQHAVSCIYHPAYNKFWKAFFHKAGMRRAMDSILEWCHRRRTLSHTQNKKKVKGWLLCIQFQQSFTGVWRIHPAQPIANPLFLVNLTSGTGNTGWPMLKTRGFMTTGL